MGNNFGIGISATNDFPITMKIVGGTQIVIEAIYRRLTTDNGALAFIGDDPSYGFNLRSMINDDLDDIKISAYQSDIVAQCILGRNSILG